MLCAIWALLGTFGHDPWKTEDATAFGIAYEMMQRGDVLVPRLAGEPFVDRPPLVYAAAAAAATVFSPVLPMPDAARLAAAVVLGLTMLLLAASAAELLGRELRWMAVLLFIGSVGLWDRAHQLSPEQGLMLGVAAALYGFALALRRPSRAARSSAAGIAVSFLSRGLLGPLWIGSHGAWRCRQRFATGGPAGTHSPWPSPSRRASARRRVAARTFPSRAPDHFTPGGRRNRSPTISSRCRLRRRRSDLPAEESSVVRLAGSPARALDAGDARARFQRRARDARVQLPAILALVIAVSMLAKTEPRAIELMPMLVPFPFSARSRSTR